MQSIVSPLLSLLHRAREEHGCVPLHAIEEIARAVGMPVASVLGISASYDAFRDHEPVFRIGVPDCPSNIVRGAGRLFAQLAARLRGVHYRGVTVSVEWVSCHGRCTHAPYLVVDDHVYTHVSTGMVNKLIRRITTGTYRTPTLPVRTLPPIPELRGFTRALGMDGAAIIREITDAGLLGFGGALFAAGKKWQGSLEANARADPNLPRVLYVNFDEGEAGTCKDGAIVRGDVPHFCVWTLLEGILIAAYAVRATHGIVYTRYEYPEELALLTHAIERFYQARLLGPNILGTGWGFELEVVRGAGGYVRGELTAGMDSTRGQLGIPYRKQGRTSVSGYSGYPTLVNNVETLAWAARILRQGSAWYRHAGTPRLYTVSGDVCVPQVLEAPQHMTLRELIELAGGLRGKRFVMAFPGGNATVPITTLDVPFTCAGLKSVGSSPGSGAVMVIGDHGAELLWEVPRHVAAFFQRESCGQCALCRIGTARACEVLMHGTPTNEEIDGLRTLVPAMQQTLCGLGQGALLPVVRACELVHEGGTRCA